MRDVYTIQTHPKPRRWLVLMLLLTLVLTLAVLPVRSTALRLTQRGERPLAPGATTWSDFAPTGWVTALPATGSVTAASDPGLDPATAGYAVSTDTGDTWSAWSTAGLTVTGIVSTTQTLAVTNLDLPDSGSANFIRFKVSELGGAQQLSPNYTLRVDTARPASNVTQPADGAALRVAPAIGGTASDGAGSGVSQVEISIRRNSTNVYWDGTGWASGERWLTATGTATWSYAATTPAWTDGTDYTIRSRATDAAGNTETPGAGIRFVFDTTAPAPPFGLTGSPARRWTNVNNFSEMWTNPFDVSGIAGAYYRLDSAAAHPTDGIFVNTSDRITDIIVPEDGKHDLYLWLVDAAGNVSQFNRNIDPQVFWYDGTPPSSAVAFTPPLPANGWYSATVTAAFQGEDPVGGSGLEAVNHRIDGSPWSTEPTAQITTEGQHEIGHYAQDVAGNWEPVRLAVLGLDMTPPTISLTPARPPQADGWYTAPITFTLSAADSLSGNPQAYYRINGGAWQNGLQLQATTDGSYQIEYFGEDAARNRSAIGTFGAKLDSTPPSTAYLIEGSQGQNGWYTSPLTITLIATDNVAGVAATYYRIDPDAWQTGSQFQLAGDGFYTLLFYSVDAAGNTETGFPLQLRLDTAAPGAPTAVETAPTGWSRVNRFSVQWANPTDLSGLAGAYYRMDTAPSSATDGTFSPLTNRLDGLTVASEGEHAFFLWLRDNAGNADHRNRAQAPPLRYDATPPTTTVTLQGPAGSNGWYRGPVTVTLTTTDGASGTAFLRYRLDAGPWLVTTASSTSLLISTEDKHVLEFTAQDVAGNAEPTREQTIRIDATPPPAPIALSAGPAGWQRYNSYSLLWTAPLDQSGIAGAYVKFGAPPTGPTDGTFHPGSEAIHGLAVPGEGIHDLYVWLCDQAGNSDAASAVALPAALWYDGTPPHTEVRLDGSLGQNGWYVGPITFTMSAVDATAGLDSIRYQVDESPWSIADGFTLADEGRHVVRISSTDIAGNAEPPQVFNLSLDSRPPIAQLEPLPRYQAKPSFEVSWQGYDPEPGSSLKAYAVEVRDGYADAWRTWLAYTTQTRALFSGERGHTYFFRVAASDLAGNRQSFTASDARAMVETVLNGGFDTGNFTDWSASGTLFKAVVPTAGPSSTNILAARLGSEDYGPSLTDPGSVPVGDATIMQAVRVPDASQMFHPTLVFWYRVLTYDVMYSKVCRDGICDTFDVTVDDGSTATVLLRDGNPTTKYKELYDTGWQRALLDLTPFAGQTVQLEFSNWNRHDNKFNTWSFVDDIRLMEWPLYSTYLSVALGADGSGAASLTGTESPKAIPATELGDEIADTDDER